MVAQFVEGLEGTLDAAAAANPYAGNTTVHRLNRAEYANAVRDMLGVEADLSSLLPSDGGDFGFDNIAEVLTTSPLLLERYLTVALRVADMAVGNPDAAVTATAYRIPFELTQDKHLDGMPLGTRGGTRVLHTFPADGEYVFSGRLVRGVEEGLFGVEGHDRPHEFLILVDGKTVWSAEIGGAELHELSVAEGFNAAQDVVNEKMTSLPVPSPLDRTKSHSRGRERAAREQNSWEPGLRASLEAHNPSGMPRLEDGVVEGPYNVTGVSDTPTRERLFVCRPASAAEESACAEQVSVVAGAARVPPARRLRGHRGVARVLQRRACRWRRLRQRYSRGRGAHAREPLVPVPRRGRLARRAGRFQPRDQRLSSSRRDCRSSSGRASPTTSCSVSPRRASCARRTCSRRRCGA